MASRKNEQGRNSQSNFRTLFFVLLVVVAMIMLTYAAPPLYRTFCEITGFGGTPKINSTPIEARGERMIKVRFEAAVAPDLEWEFEPLQKDMELATGENGLIFYRAKNVGAAATIGTATYNIVPDQAGGYFNKIECFCFQEQLLEVGEEKELPVSFFLDPDIEKDPLLKDVKEIVLFYHFFKVNKGE